ncbi:NAD dependent epimerase/dehydratase [Colletotrichum tamarilloi]|uniref:NAD dependent epimerase/dehydratase n=1 Tax=Colletotrichum tamarilloi TaxID=1209934 RepID=A0ABQ9RNN4_9PEZI|nr:NAD dependent epimerase/dehydratase [Colletotrichum tamarilloi]KAK1508368.1 NAD dependent epimerase/dehydratase [Colletotrichum tamarilloi]
MTKILLTGGSGFIAAHILEQLLARGHSVVTTVRSEDKAQRIRDAHKDLDASRLHVAIVPDIARPDAFDEVVKTPGLEAVLHTASPFHFKWTDAQKELIDPAVVGTTAILKALKRDAPGVKRVVVTSSFASVIDEAKTEDPNTIFTEEFWNPVTVEDIGRSPATAYRASKKLAEKAAWDFVNDEKPGFDLVTLTPPLVLGPVVHHFADLASINTSNEHVVDLVKGKWKDAVAPTGAAYLWIDVRDLALSHILALEKPEAGGKRLFTTAGWFSNAEIAQVVRKNFPELKERLPAEGTKGGELPPKDKVYGYDNSATEKILGIKWKSLEESITDLVKDIKGFGI